MNQRSNEIDCVLESLGLLLLIDYWFSILNGDDLKKVDLMND